MLLQEGKQAAYVASQIGDSIKVTLDTYTHLIEDLDHDAPLRAVEAIEAARSEFDVRGEYADAGEDEEGDARDPASILEADARTRTADPFITSDDATP